MRLPGGMSAIEVRSLAALGSLIASYALLKPTATYHALELGGGVVGVSLIVACASGISVIGALPVGRWIDRAGSRTAFLAGSGLLLLGALTGGFSPHLGLLAVAMSAVGIGQVTVVVATQAAAAAQGGSPNVQQGLFARNAMSASVGQIVGPALAGWILASSWGIGPFSTTGAFLAGAVLSAISFALAFGLPRGRAAAADPAAVEKLSIGLMGNLVRRPGMPAALVSGVAVLITLDVLIAFLPLVGERAGLSPAVVGGLLSVRGGCALASRAGMTGAIRVLGMRAILVGSMAASAVALAAIAFTNDVILLALLIGVFGFGTGVCAPLTAAWVARLAPITLRGTALGLRVSGNRLGQTIVPLGLGVLASRTDISLVFLAPALFLISCAAWLVRADHGASGDIAPTTD